LDVGKKNVHGKTSADIWYMSDKRWCEHFSKHSGGTKQDLKQESMNIVIESRLEMRNVSKLL
jgi:hypothetical protein